MNSAELISIIESSISLAEQQKSKLINGILEMDGMSGYKTRHFLNNLMNRGGIRYMEVGTWKGSTLISSLYQNNPEYSVAIDNFSQFDGPKNEFEENCTKFLGKMPNFIEGDCFGENVKERGINNINVYFYDGEHSEWNQCRALVDMMPYLANEFIYIVDDWNWGSVRNGSNEGVQKANLEVLYKKEILTPNEIMERDGWWNGLYIGVLKKKN